ncbi:MAG: FtsX-like permease family protein [Spirochaetes bacterium]|nr:FtsX-like permease family protein [Spirochaetota bacterium]
MWNFIGIAFKNVFRQKKRSFTLGANYAIVAFLLVLLFSFSRGASDNISTSLVRSSAGHITISGQFAKGGRIFNGIERSPEVAAIAEAQLGRGAVVLPRYLVQSAVYYKGLSKRLGFTGIDMAKDEGFRGQMVFSSGSWEDLAADPNGVVLPGDIAGYFALATGETVVLSTRTRFGAFNTGILTVRGIYETDNFFMRGFVLTHFEFLRALDLADAGAATTMYAWLPRPTGLAEKRDALSDALAAAGFEVSKPRNDSEAISAVSAASVKYEADKEGRDRVMLKLSTLDEVLGIVRSVLGAVNAVGGAVAGILLAVIIASIFINLRMTINERLREIGTMRAIGMDRGGVAALFVTESAILALAFSAAGAAFAVIVAFAAGSWLSFPPGGQLGIFLSSGRLVLSPRLEDIGAVVAAIAAFAAFFSFFPARRGGSISPVEALTKTF